MTDTEKRKVLNALYSYQAYKTILRTSTADGATIIYAERARFIKMNRAEMEKSIKVAEGTYKYFEIQDEAKARFIKKFFFQHGSWVSTELEIGLSHGTVKNWRNEVIKIAAKIARRAELI